MVNWVLAAWNSCPTWGEVRCLLVPMRHHATGRNWSVKPLLHDQFTRAAAAEFRPFVRRSTRPNPPKWQGGKAGQGSTRPISHHGRRARQCSNMCRAARDCLLAFLPAVTAACLHACLPAYASTPKDGPQVVPAALPSWALLGISSGTVRAQGGLLLCSPSQSSNTPATSSSPALPHHSGQHQQQCSAACAPLQASTFACRASAVITDKCEKVEQAK